MCAAQITPQELYTRLYLESTYGLKREGFGKKVLAWLKENAPPPLRVLEFGAGRGFFADRLAKAGYRVMATEITASIMSIWPGSFSRRICWLPEDAQELEDDSFDVVISLDVLEHLETEELVSQTLAHMARITREYVLLTIGLKRSLSRSDLPGVDVDLHPQRHPTDWWHWMIGQHMTILSHEETGYLTVYARKRKVLSPVEGRKRK